MGLTGHDIGRHLVLQRVDHFRIVHRALVPVPERAPETSPPRPNPAVAVDREHVVPTSCEFDEGVVGGQFPRHEQCLHRGSLHVGVDVNQSVIRTLLTLTALTVGVVAPRVDVALIRQHSGRKVAARRPPRIYPLAEETHDDRRLHHIRECAPRLRVVRPFVHLPVLNAAMAELPHVGSAPREDLALVGDRHRVPHADSNVDDLRVR
mmetsp:Transcript_46592/g.117156  ORF Transcript_46592/g.117156 Transcript_46592/m.117156 type:complete len:207 (+) Transcript_46592:1573-2193(+)